MLKTLDDILLRIRAGCKEMDVDAITDKHEILKMIQFINDDSNDNEERQDIINIMNLLGFDIRPFCVTHYFDMENKDLCNKGYEYLEPLKSEDIYYFLMPYLMHQVAEDDIRKEAAQQAWLNTPVRVINIREKGATNAELN